MLAPERQSRILAELDRAESVRVAELAIELNVSEMTIRRDIEALDNRALLRRIHGGAARLRQFSAVEPGFASNVGSGRARKEAIAALALSMVKPGMTIALTGGTTTFALARLLFRVPNVTVVTNSFKAAEVLYEQLPGRSQTVLITGGERTPSEALVGPLTNLVLEQLNVDLCFMGVHGLDPERGLTSPNAVEAETNRAFIRAAEALVVLADHSKFNVTSLAQIAPLRQVSTLITDTGASKSLLAPFAALVADLRVAPTPSHS